MDPGLYEDPLQLGAQGVDADAQNRRRLRQIAAFDQQAGQPGLAGRQANDRVNFSAPCPRKGRRSARDFAEKMRAGRFRILKLGPAE